MQQGQVFFIDAGNTGTVQTERQMQQVAEGEDTGLMDYQAKNFFKSFLLQYQNEEKKFIYREQLKQQLALDQFYVQIRDSDFAAYNAQLSVQMHQDPARFLPIFEEACKEALLSLRATMPQQAANTAFFDIPTPQVIVQFDGIPSDIRHLNANDVSKLVCVSGIIINCSRTIAKVQKACIRCSSCKSERYVSVKPGMPQLFSNLQGFTAIPIPNRCTGSDAEGNACPPNTFGVVAEKSSFIDTQTMKLQEAPEMIPTGEMPRSVVLHCDRYLVERFPPGTRVHVVGVFSTFNSTGKSFGTTKKAHSISIRQPYIRAVGVFVNLRGSGRTEMLFDKKEEDECIQMSKDVELYSKIAKSIDPAIYGHADIKKALCCQLFGGASKRLPDGIRRRGDINILLLGDPSTAKSQLLKYVEKVAPIGVYTSGKGSSAAGLTACVMKEQGTGEFYLEGGSMVLADGGIVCIDEFDKMRAADRVAIHEAMEQQTISIAKAGITTVLNSRTSVLAAANPVFGRYDDMKSAEEQIDFQTTILSRFDMIFIVRDVRDVNRDREIAKHVLNVHVNKKAPESTASDVSIDKMKRYIAYCRAKCSPRLSEAAAELLKNHYVNQRSAQKSKDKSVIPITVRQLEALVRISESLARMRLLPVANEEHAREAIRLFTASTVDAINSGIISEVSLNSEFATEVQKVEDIIKSKVPIGGRVGFEALAGMLERMGHKRYVVDRCIFIMVQRQEFDFKNERKNIIRKK